MYFELGIKYWKYHKKRAFFILFSIVLSVSALVSATLLVRSNKLQQLEEHLVACGDCDFEFYNVTEEAEKELRADERFAQFGSVYRCGYAKAQSGTDFEVGYIEDKVAEEMLHLTPITGRYPEKSGEICIDKFTLNSLGYSTQTGQQIELSCMDWDKKELQTRQFTVVGIIEQITIDEGGVQYIKRQYNVINTETGKEVIVNCPFAYVTAEDAKDIYKTDFQKILLANVAITDDFDDQDMRQALLKKYYNEDGVMTGGFLVDIGKVNNRSWMAQLLLGFSNEVTEYNGWGYNAAQARIGSDTTQKDFYSAVLIPVFFVIIILVTFFSLYNAISMTFSDRIRQNGMFRCLGMSKLRCQLHLALEVGILLVPGILGGYGLGYLIYAIVQKVQRQVFGIPVIGVGDVSEYFRPYLEEVTANPITFPLLAICITLIPAVILPAIRNGRVSPVAACAVRNRLHKKQKRFEILLYMNIFVVMVAAVFGYCYFCADNDFKNRTYETQLSSTGLAEWDYYMEQNKVYTQKGYGDEIRHDTGISKEELKLLQENPIVEKTEATIINLSTKIYVKDIEDNRLLMSTLASADIMDVSCWATTAELEKIYGIRVERERKHRGYKNDEKIYQVPSVGIQDQAWDNLQKYIVDGEIHLDRIKEGTEVVLVVTDEESCSYHVGDKLPLNDDVYPGILDTNKEYQQGVYVKIVKPTYEAEKNNWPQYCYSERKNLDVTVGAIMVIDDEQDYRKYFYDDSSIFPWNIFVSDETFQSWNLPDDRYSKVWVKCKENADVTEFERLWYQTLMDGKLMQNYIAQDIKDRIDDTNRTGMTLFFAMLFMIIIVSIVGTVHAFDMGIRMDRKRLSLLRAMGGKKGWLLRRKWVQNLFMILIGGILSLIPIYVFNQIVQKAVDITEAAVQTGEMLPDDHWARKIPGYFLTEYHPIVVAVIVAIVALLLSSLVIGLCMRKEMKHSIVDSIREAE